MPSRSDSTVEGSASTIQDFDSPGASSDSLILYYFPPVAVLASLLTLSWMHSYLGPLSNFRSSRIVFVDIHCYCCMERSYLD